MKKSLTWSETIITAVVKTCGYSAIVFVLLIFFFLLREGIRGIDVQAGGLVVALGAGRQHFEFAGQVFAIALVAIGIG